MSPLLAELDMLLSKKIEEEITFLRTYGDSITVMLTIC